MRIAEQADSICSVLAERCVMRVHYTETSTAYLLHNSPNWQNEARVRRCMFSRFQRARKLHSSHEQSVSTFCQRTFCQHLLQTAKNIAKCGQTVPRLVGFKERRCLCRA